jgi:hypothetical protein
MMAINRPMERARAQAPRIAASLLTAMIVVLFAACGGILLGLFSAIADRPEAPGVIRWLGNVPGPWVLLAFGIGAVAGSRVGGAVAAVVALASGVMSYYLYSYTSGARPWLDTVEHAMLWWGLVAVAAGIPFGWAGGSWRRGAPWERVLAVAALCGVLAGESILLMTEGGHEAGKFMVASEAVFAVALGWWLLKGFGERAAATLLGSGMSIIAIEALIVFSHRLRDAGL